jgi:hypothetical protein
MRFYHILFLLTGLLLIFFNNHKNSDNLNDIELEYSELDDNSDDIFSDSPDDNTFSDCNSESEIASDDENDDENSEDNIEL